MSVINFSYFGFVFFFISVICVHYAEVAHVIRSFTIDTKSNTFLKDGKPFRYVSGEIHYFRIPRPYWRDRLRKCRAAGLNVVQIYVEWASHELTPRNYNFNGQLDVEYFIQLASQEGFLVILRPGPYICAERDMGGLPYWLLAQHPNIVFRTNNADYKRETERWFQVLMPRLTKYLYGNGGPIIMIQVENEYGQFTDCNLLYKIWLRDVIKSYVGNAAVLFTLDRSVDFAKGCGLIPDVYGTVDFGTSTDAKKALSVIRKRFKGGPLVCTEFYTGFIDNWGLPKSMVNTSALVKSSKEMLDMGASFNYYMFLGGTNFGFTNGASDYDVSGVYRSQVTSYDYDAPLNEAGDPTEKYYAIRNLLSRYFVLPDIPVPKPSPKGNYGVIKLQPVLPLFNNTNIFRLNTQYSREPKTFEQLQQQGGYVLYETKVPKTTNNGAILDARSLRDRAHVYLNHQWIELVEDNNKFYLSFPPILSIEGAILKLSNNQTEANVSVTSLQLHRSPSILKIRKIPTKCVGVLSRTQNIFSISLPSPANKTLSLLVENQGRVSLGRYVKDPKGLLVTPKLDDVTLFSWKMTALPLDNLFWFWNKQPVPGAIHPPAFYSGTFTLTTSVPLDTYVDVSGWGKGLIFVNGINIGRYWPSTGSQVTLYLPGCFLFPAPRTNTIVLFETEITHPSYQVALTNTPKLNKILTPN